jgi:AcrR family transcriptional regulator
MLHITEPVKQTRKYDASRRRAQALETRAAILDAARSLFFANGYGKTSIAAVADEAAVSVETIYKAFGGKAGLARGLFDQALAGNEPITTGERAAIVKRDEHDPRRRLRAFGAFVCEVAPRVAPVMLLIRAAAETDPEAATLWQHINDERLEGMGRDAQQLADEGHIRNDVTVDEARDVFWTCTSPELFELLVTKRGWTPERYGQWVGDTFIATLLEPNTSPH